MTGPRYVTLADETHGGFVDEKRLKSPVLIDGKWREIRLYVARGTVRDLPCVTLSEATD